MKNSIISILCLTSFLFGSNQINLTGEYSEQLGNPFKVILEKSDKTAYVYSQDKKIELPVSTNAKGEIGINRYYNKYILSNKTVSNVVQDFYGEKYNVIISKKSKYIVNVIGGDIEIVVNKTGNIEHLSNIIVKLELEIINQGKRTTKAITMDKKLGVKGDNYNWALSLNLSNLSFKTLDQNIQRIIEVSIYKLLGGK